MQKNLNGIFFGALLLTLGVGPSAFAAGVTFDFNSLSAGNNSSTIQSYMQGVLNTAYGNGVVTVTVTGAIADNGAVQSSNLHWTGDGHTVGGNSGTPTSITLGNSNNCTGNGCTAGSNDTYIRNDSLGLAGPTSDLITMTFTGKTFTGAAFDWEIFPDGSCTAKDNVHCGGAGNPNLPDFIFKANGNQVFSAASVVPGVGSTYSRSPLGAETAPQAIGTGSWTFAASNTLVFQDWPATIGIDRLTLTPSTTPVPEPGSVALLLTTVVGCFIVRRKRQKA